MMERNMKAPKKIGDSHISLQNSPEPTPHLQIFSVIELHILFFSPFSSPQAKFKKEENPPFFYDAFKQHYENPHQQILSFLFPSSHLILRLGGFFIFILYIPQHPQLPSLAVNFLLSSHSWIQVFLAPDSSFLPVLPNFGYGRPVRGGRWWCV